MWMQGCRPLALPRRTFRLSMAMAEVPIQQTGRGLTTAPCHIHGEVPSGDRSPYRRPPPRRLLRFSVYFISESLLSEACMKCLSRSSKVSGSLGCRLNPP